VAHAIRRAKLTNGLVVPYVEAGDPSGTPVVLLHAYADSWRSFELLLPGLPRSIHAFAPSQRGHGDADEPASGYRVEDFADDLAAFLDAVSIERALLVASSSATYTVQRAALADPSRVAGLVLIGAPWSLREKRPSLAFLKAVSELRDPVDATFVREFVAGTASPRVPPTFLEAMISESLKVPAHVWRQTLDGLLQADPPETGAIDAPTLIVWGDHDAIVPRDDQERLRAAISGSRLLVYERAGHMVHWEEPQRVARDVTSFVDELTP
jgi:non-heme chloroperoxidase